MTKLAKTALTLIAALTLTPAPALAGMSSSQFHALGAPTSGTVSVSTTAGKTVVTIKGLKTEVGPDLQVRLYKLAAPNKADKDTALQTAPYLKIGELKKFSGDFTFSVPAGTRLNDYKSIVIWCAQVQTAFGAAPLN